MAISVKLGVLSVALVLAIFAGTAYSRSKVITLDEDNWDVMLEQEWMVEFYAPWCPACRALEPIWNEFSTWSEELGLKVAKVDVTNSPGLSGRFIVTALPTIYHVLNGEFRQYHGSRDKESFMSFIEQQKWKTLDPIPSWKSPASFHMGATAYFFKLSQLLRAVHNRLMEEYGLPTWGSYIIFAIATIVLGAILGLVMVCVIDNIIPCKPSESQAGKRVGPSDRGDVDDLVDEEGSQSSNDERYSKSSSGAEDDEDDEDDEEEDEKSAGSAPPSPAPGTPGKARQRRARKAD
ncbi:thioredoxin-related transmembrane protein 1 [Thrips palmi]|uniref:Thioredoxin-related transmembrane protein 1 n=1 Tax=Thrips palmi TaxID=161013 RepID=A0A6P8Z1Q6_THRPL|nr:thioredoxin-related transmembrane protein 1 [Thrips palmi]